MMNLKNSIIRIIILTQATAPLIAVENARVLENQLGIAQQLLEVGVEHPRCTSKEILKAALESLNDLTTKKDFPLIQAKAHFAISKFFLDLYLKNPSKNSLLIGEIQLQRGLNTIVKSRMPFSGVTSLYAQLAWAHKEGVKHGLHTHDQARENIKAILNVIKKRDMIPLHDPLAEPTRESIDARFKTYSMILDFLLNVDGFPKINLAPIKTDRAHQISYLLN